MMRADVWSSNDVTNSQIVQSRVVKRVVMYGAHAFEHVYIHVAKTVLASDKFTQGSNAQIKWLIS